MNSHTVTSLDVILGLLMLLSGMISLLRGFTREVLGIAAWIGAGFAVLYGLKWVKPFVRDLIPWTWAADGVAAVVIFVLALMLLAMMSRAIGAAVRMALFGALDHSLGFLFGLARGALIVAFAYFLVDSFIPVVERPPWLQEARSLFLIQRGAAFIRSLVPDDLAGKARATAEAVAEGVRKMQEAEQTYHHLSNPVPVPTHRAPERLRLP